MKEVRCLTLAQPWPKAFELGKRVENRSWKPYLASDGYLALHGGRESGSKQFWADWAFIQRTTDNKVKTPTQTRGLFAICKVSKVVESVNELPSEQQQWFFGPVGWLLTDLVFFPEPIPTSGAQGLWHPSPDQLAKMRFAYKIATNKKADF